MLRQVCEYLIRALGFLPPPVKYVLVIRNASGQEHVFGFVYKASIHSITPDQMKIKSCTKGCFLIKGPLL